MTPRALLPLLALGALLAPGCDDAPGPAGPTKATAEPVGPRSAAPSQVASAAPPPPTATAVPSAPAPPSASAAAKPRRDAPFVRVPPHSANSDADWVDACLQVGGSYYSCGGAIREADAAGDQAYRRFLWRIAQAHAAGKSTYDNGPDSDDDVAHAEVPAMCDVTKPCGGDPSTMVSNTAETCLSRTLTETSPARARAAHAKACQCDKAEGAIPAYNGTPFICDAAGKPAFIAPGMKPDVAKDILDCALCHPKRGPKACEAEMKRHAASDAELAAFILDRHIPRCQTKNEGPRSWDELE